MSALLLAWLESSVSLPRTIKFLEKDLSNGFLLGQVLGQLDMEADASAYVDSDDVPAILRNFERLAASLRAVDIRISVDLARSIMMEKKDHVDRKQQSRPKHLEPATASLRPPPGNSHRHMTEADPTDPSARFVEDLINSIDPSDWNNHNRVDMAIHLRKFTEFMWSSSDATANYFASEKERRLQAAQQSRDDELAHTHEKQGFMREWTDLGREKWAANQQHKRAREAEQLQFELSLRERRRVIVAHQNDAAAMDLHDGVSSFDKNFKRLGISSGDEDGVARLMPAKGTGLEHLVELERRVEGCHFRPSSNIQMMKELRDRRKMHLNAQRERASRRRKMLVDQTRNTIEISRKQEESALLHRLVVVGKRRRETLRKLWEHGHNHDKAKLEASGALVSQTTAFAATLEMAVALSLDELRAKAMAPAAVTKRLEVLRVAQEEARAHAEHKAQGHAALCSDVLASLLTFVHAIVAFRAEQHRPMPAPLYRSLKEKFVSGALVGKPLDTTATQASFSAIELQLLTRDYVQGRGVFATPDLPVLDSSATTAIETTLSRLATVSPSVLLQTPWPPLERNPHPLLICWYTKDSTSTLAATLGGATGLQVWTVDMCVERCVKLSERGKPVAGDKPTPLEADMAALGAKVAQAKAKGGVVADAVVTDMVCKTIVHLFSSNHGNPAFLGGLLVNFPRTKDEAKSFETEMVKRFVELSEADAAARVARLAAAWEDKPPDDATPLRSGVDWAIFVDCSVEKLEAAITVQDPTKRDAAIRDLHSRCETWQATTAGLRALWKPFGCAYSVNTDATTPDAIHETLHALLRLPAACNHELAVADADAFERALAATKQLRRDIMPREELLVTRDLCGEHPLPMATVAELNQELNHRDPEQLDLDRHAALRCLYDGLQRFSHSVVRIRQKLLELLDAGPVPQAQINEVLQKLHTCSTPQETSQLLMALEVRLGDTVDALRGAANAFLQAPESWTYSVEEYQDELGHWAQGLLRLEIRQYRRRQAQLDAYFEAVDPMASGQLLSDDVIATSTALQTVPPTSRFSEVFADLLADVLGTTGTTGTTEPFTAPNVRQVVQSAELARFLQRVVAIGRYVDTVVARLDGLRESEGASLDGLILQFVKQEFRFISDVVAAVRRSTANKGHCPVKWPRLQSLLTPLDAHGIRIEHHVHFLSPAMLIQLVQSLQSASNYAPTLSIAAFTTAMVEAATEGRFPAVWASFTNVVNAALAFSVHGDVDWRRFVLSALCAQMLPLPHVHDLDAIRRHLQAPLAADAVVDRNAFAGAPLWTSQSDIVDVLCHLFANAAGDVVVLNALLHACVATYPMNIIRPCHVGLPPFPRGIAKAYRLLLNWGDDGWTMHKMQVLWGFTGLPPPDVAPETIANVENFLEFCTAHASAVVNKFMFLNVYDYLAEAL
ncbi:hypothetical protein ACHHYP_00619 [Achlya hypogyna]|uniref:CH-like domain-containing protein n=1 Tax=Achlya hypogyna TaxID=1202772 RepID=A0A1V9ZUB0_ACHHY|nr:hypothetical protein ACHHYP_00619 [Achlya hypogyna]